MNWKKGSQLHWVDLQWKCTNPCELGSLLAVNVAFSGSIPLHGAKINKCGHINSKMSVIQY